MHHLKAKCQKIWNQEHVNQRFGAFLQDFPTPLDLYFEQIAELLAFGDWDW